MVKAVLLILLLVSFSTAQAESPLHIDSLNCALLIIDMQNDFTEEKGKNPADPKKTGTAIETINALSKVFHEKGKPVILIRNVWKNPLRGMFFGFAGKDGTWGGELNGKIRAPGAIHFAKGAPSAFSNDSLVQLINERKITSLFFTGVKAGQCVMAGIKDSNNRGLNTFAVLDGIAADDEKAEAKAFGKYSRLGIVSIYSKSIK